MNSIIFDIGGTKMRVAFSADGQTFEAPQSVLTPASYDDGLKLFVETAKRCANGRKIEAVCGGIAGPFTERKRSLMGSPNLSDWIGKPLKNNLEESLGAPIYIENDSALVGLGEAIDGAGKGTEIVAYITVSTGVGGVRIVDGKIDERNLGFEPGHQIIDFQNMQTLESLVSGKSVQKKYGQEPKDIKEAEVWETLAKILAVGLANTIMHWSPQVLVLGGSMIIGNPAIPIESVEKHLKEIIKIFPELPTIKKARLGDFGGLYGALAYLQTHIS